MPKKLTQDEGGPLSRLFKSSTARILDHFLCMDCFEYSKTEIAEATELSIRTVMRELPILESYGIIKHTGTVGQAEKYKTNINNPIVIHLNKASLEIADLDVEKELLSQGFSQEFVEKQMGTRPTWIKEIILSQGNHSPLKKR